MKKTCSDYPVTQEMSLFNENMYKKEAQEKEITSRLIAEEGGKEDEENHDDDSGDTNFM